MGEPIQSRLEGFSRDGDGRDQSGRECADEARPVAEAGADGGVGNAEKQRIGTLDRESRSVDGQEIKDRGPSVPHFWSDAIYIPCADGKARPTQPGIQPLAHGVQGGGVAISSAVQEGITTLSEEEKGHIFSRTGVLKGAGNAIVPQVAAEFVRAFMEINKCENVPNV